MEETKLTVIAMFSVMLLFSSSPQIRKDCVIPCTAPFICTALHLAKCTSVDVNALSKVRWWVSYWHEDQCNNTPNGSPQFTQVPLQDWAVFIIPSSYKLHISPCPLPSLRRVTSNDSCNIPSCFHMALQLHLFWQLKQCFICSHINKECSLYSYLV